MTKDDFIHEAALAYAEFNHCHNVERCFRSRCTCFRTAATICDRLWPIIMRMVDATRPPPPIPPGTMIVETLPNGDRAWTMK